MACSNSITLKKCVICGEGKGIDDYHNHKKYKDGKDSRCKVCVNKLGKKKGIEASRRDAAAYAKRHPEKIKERFRAWYNKDKDERLARLREKRRNASEEMKAKDKAWRDANNGRINELRRIRRANMSVTQRLEKNIRDRFNKVIIRMKSGKKFVSSMVLIGCSIDELKAHIERQFKDGMRWDNHGNGDGKWNIDHIIPLVKFNLHDIEDQKKAFNYSNLRPLWFIDNMTRPRKHFSEAA